MTNKPRQRSTASAKDDVDSEQRQQAEHEDEVTDNISSRGQKAEEKRALLEELAEYEPRIAYD
jgi:hypothetical protein